MGKNPEGKIYDDLELILRDAKHIEGFIKNSMNKTTPTLTKAEGEAVARGVMDQIIQAGREFSKRQAQNQQIEGQAYGFIQ